MLSRQGCEHSSALSNLLLVTHLPQAFFPLVCCHFMTFALFSAWHTVRPPYGYC